MDQGAGLCFPAILPDWQMPGKSAERQSRDGASDPGLVDTAMVSKSVGDVDRFPNIIAAGSKLADGAHMQVTLVDAKPANMASGMENLRRQWQATGISEQASGILKNSRRIGCESVFNSPWGKYAGWCAERQIDPFQSSVADVVNFLVEMYHKQLEYSTLNIYRSAI